MKLLSDSLFKKSIVHPRKVYQPQTLTSAFLLKKLSYPVQPVRREELPALEVASCLGSKRVACTGSAVQLSPVSLLSLISLLTQDSRRAFTSESPAANPTRTSCHRSHNVSLGQTLDSRCPCLHKRQCCEARVKRDS
jgi:hypothetical protein